MTLSKVHHSSERTDWTTPIGFFRRVEARIGKPFDLDAAASKENALCPTYFTEADDGLSKSWEGHNVWCNHPYGAKLTKQWQAKAYIESLKPGTRVTLLSPSRTCTKAFHEIILPTANLIIFIKGRLHFDGAKDPAPFPSVVYHWNGTDTHQIESMEACR